MRKALTNLGTKIVLSLFEFWRVLVLIYISKCSGQCSCSGKIQVSNSVLRSTFCNMKYFK